jgi:hypothetical protein
MKKKLIIITAVLLLAFFAFSGCKVEQAAQTEDNTSTSVPADTQMTISGEINTDTVNLDTETNADDDIDRISKNVSNKDLDADYFEDDATSIHLSDAGTDINGEGAAIQGSVITISNAGTYIINGTLSEGQILVDATKVDTVRLVLDGVDITNKSGSAIVVDKAEKVIITLAEGSQNHVRDTTQYEDEDADADAAIYADDDLTINGSGSLTVEGRYKHGIKTVDDLVITGGTLSISSAEEALKGKDSITITNGSVTIDAAGDGIKSDNDKDEDSGWILIEGGTFDISAGDNGIEAEVGLKITGGDFNISSAQDALHSNGSIRISGGNIVLSANDDGVHADNSLDITGGNILVTHSYEGLEASDITIRGGNIAVNARDDGINAAGGSDGDAAPGDRFRQSGNYFISVSGGYTYVNADGDGVDSNGSIEVSGGVLIVDGPESGGNSAMDMENSGYVVSGGTLIAAGSVQMLVTPTQAAQPVVTIIFDSVQSANTTFALADVDGNVLFAASPVKSYQSLQISSPELVLGETYTLLYGGNISGESTDGTYYINGTYVSPSGSAQITLNDSIMTIAPDGTASQYSGWGMPGGGRNPGSRQPGGKP